MLSRAVSRGGLRFSVNQKKKLRVFWFFWVFFFGFEAPFVGSGLAAIIYWRPHRGLSLAGKKRVGVKQLKMSGSLCSNGADGWRSHGLRRFVRPMGTRRLTVHWARAQRGRRRSFCRGALAKNPKRASDSGLGAMGVTPGPRFRGGSLPKLHTGPPAHARHDPGKKKGCPRNPTRQGGYGPMSDLPRLSPHFSRGRRGDRNKDRQTSEAWLRRDSR